MAKRIIKPDSGNTLVLQEDNGSVDALTVETNGNTTLGGNLVIPNSGTIGSASDTDAITIDSSGNVGIGTSSPAGKFVIAGTLGNFQFEPNGATVIFTRNGANYIAATGALGYLIFNTGGTESLRIDSSGNVELKTTNANLILPSGGGISFPDATQINSATDDNATLSTYETGYVPNPIYVGGTQYNLNSGEDELHYIRIGDLVFLTGELDSTGQTNTATGAITLKLPFTSASSAGGNLSSLDCGQRAYIGSTTYLCGVGVGESATEASVFNSPSVTNFSVTSNQRIVLQLSFCYYAA